MNFGYPSIQGISNSSRGEGSPCSTAECEALDTSLHLCRLQSSRRDSVVAEMLTNYASAVAVLDRELSVEWLGGPLDSAGE